MIPNELKTASASRNHLDIYSYSDHVVIESVLKGEGQRLEEDCCLENLDEECWQDIIALSEKLPPRLFLSPHDFHAINIRLPARAMSDPRSALSLQLPLYCPLNISQIEWEYFKAGDDKIHADFTIVIARSSRLNQIEMIFADNGAMPPTIAAKIDEHVLSFREPLIMSKGFTQDRKLQLRVASFLLLLSIPLTIILGSSFTIANNEEYARVLEADAKPKIIAWRDAQQQENLRRKLIPLSGRQTLIPKFNDLATLLPETMWVRSAKAQNSDAFLIDVSGPPNSDVKAILEQSQKFRSVELIDTQEINPNDFIYSLEVTIQ